MEALADAINMALFFDNEVSFKKDDVTGAGVMLVLENKEKNLKEQVLLPRDHITDEKFIKYIRVLSNAIYEKCNQKKT